MTHHADAANDAHPPDAASPLPAGWLGRWPWLTFVLPFAVFMVGTLLEPKPPASNVDSAAAAGTRAEDDRLAVGGLSEDEAISEDDVAESGTANSWLPAIDYKYYPVTYTAKILLTLVAMALVWPGYRTFPWRVSATAVWVGVLGGVLWVGLSKLRLEPKILSSLGLDWLLGAGQRSAFNPLEELATNPGWAYGFLAIRLFGLAIVVPVIEEFFLRGFLMRLVVHDQWHQVPFGTANRAALLAATIYGVATHPAEMVAAAVWFSLVSWLMVRTRNIWDCVVAHVLTNGLMGAWVLYSGDWWFM